MILFPLGFIVDLPKGSEAAGDLYGPIDAETGDLSQFTSSAEAGTNTFRNDAGAKDHGSYGFKLSFAGTNATAYAYKTFAAADTEWHRFYLYVPSSFDINATYNDSWLFGLKDGGSHVGQFGVRAIYGSTKPVQWGFRYAYTNQNSNTNFSVDAWHLIEIKYVRSATVGGMALYVDSSLVMSDLDQDTSAIYPDESYLGHVQNVTTPTNGSYIYYDDLIGTTTQRGPYSV